MFLQRQAVARWVAWDQSSLSQAFPPWHHGSWPPTSLGVCFVPSTSSLPVTTPWILPSPNTIEPLLALPPFRPPLLSPSLHAASIKLHLLPAASLLHMVEPPVAVSIPATLSASAPLHRPTVVLLASRRPLFPSQGVHFCFSSLISPLSSVGCYVQSVPWGGGWSSSSSSFSSPAPARRPNLSSGAWSSSQQRFRRHPLAPLRHRYPPLHRVSRNDKRCLGRRHHIQAYRKFANTHHLCDITTNMASLTTAEALHAILQAPTKLRDTMPKDGSFPIIWDSGASISVTNNKADFLTFTKVSPRHNNIMGVAQGLKFSGFGEVLWSFLDEKGTLRSFKLPALYIPSATTRLLSTMSLLLSYSSELIEQTGRGMCLSGTSDGQRNAVEATINPNNNLPTSTGYSYGKAMEAANTLVNTVSTTAATNTNLGPADKELLRWHNRLGHIGMRKVQFLMRTGILATSEATRRLHAATCKLTNLPLCSACQFGKQRCRPEPGKITTIVRERDGALKDRRLLPRQTVSVDHFVCSTMGRLFTSRGCSKDADMYTGGAIYVDMATNLVHVEFQRHLNTHKTLAATAEFEWMCLDAGVIPQEYLSDNGSAFTSKEYMTHLRQFSQISRFAGVGAHHHNGVAEHVIQTIMSIARTMMLHAAIHWPDMADPSLWPMAVQHAVFLHNHVPSPSTGLCPHDLFFKT